MRMQYSCPGLLYCFVFSGHIVVVQSLSHVDSLRPHGLQHVRLPCSSPSLGVCSKFMSIESVMPSNRLILCPPLLLLPSVVPSIRVFSSESALCIRWPKYQSFSFSISPSNEYLNKKNYPGLVVNTVNIITYNKCILDFRMPSLENS